MSSLAAGLLVALSTIGLAATSAWLIVRAAERPGVLSLTVPMGLVQLFALAKAAGRYLERTLTHRTALRVMGSVRARVARALVPQLPAGLGPRSHEVVDLALVDVERVQDLLTAVAGPLAVGAVAGLISVVIAGLISPAGALWLLLGFLVSGFVLPWLAAHFGVATAERADALRHELTGLFANVARSGDEYLLNGAAPLLLARVDELEDRADHLAARRAQLVGLTQGLGVAVAGVTTWATARVAANGVIDGHLARSLVAVVPLLSVAALELVSSVTPSFVGLRGDRRALARLDELAARPAPVREPERDVVLSPLTELRGDELTHAYDDTPTLREASLRVHVGDVIVLEGRSGEGKTTLAHLLAKFATPRSGSLRANDLDYDEIVGRELRTQLGVVDDDPHLFLTSLAGNLRIGSPTATDEELVEVLTRVGLEELIPRLNDGLGAIENGTPLVLSGGERRRVGIARQLLSQRRWLLVDEPTEGLDADAAERVMAALRAHCRNGALIVISHRDVGPGATQRWTLAAGTLTTSPLPPVG